MKSVYTGDEKVAEFESYDELRVGENKPAFIYEGSELVYPNPVKDGLVLWYDFSGRTNADSQRGIAEDLSGNGNHGTLQNFNFTEESGYDGNKLKFDGVDDLITGNTELPSSNEFTLEIFMTAGTGFGGVTKGNYGAWASNEWGFRDLNRSHQFYYSNGDKSVGVNFLRREGKLSHYICILNENDLTVYLNGTEITSIPRNGDLRPTQQKLEVGRAYSGATLANHDYHSIKFYNRPLSPEEIAHNYAIEKERFNIGGAE